MKKYLFAILMISALYSIPYANIYEDVYIEGVSVCKHSMGFDALLILIYQKDANGNKFYPIAPGNGYSFYGFYYPLAFSDYDKSIIAQIMYAHSTNKKITAEIDYEHMYENGLCAFLPEKPNLPIIRFNWILVQE